MEIELLTLDLGGVNCFLFRTPEGFVLVDTGFSFQREALDKELTALGCRPGNLKLILLTHGDGDHIGNCAYLRGKYGAQVAMHRDDAAAGGGDPKRDRRVKLGPMSFLEIFASLGMAIRALRSGSIDSEPFDVDFFLEDGRSLADFGVDAIVVHLPGHSRGSVGVLTAAGDLICGDLFMNLVRPNLSSISLGDEATRATIAKVDALGIREVLPGHGRPFPWKRYAKKFTRSPKR